MKHLKKGRKFSRKKKQRKALLKTMLSAFLLKGKIRTTEAKAKELKKETEKVVSDLKRARTKGKEAGLAKLRQAKTMLPAGVSMKVLSGIAEKFKKKEGGYAKIIKLGQRKSDGAPMAVLEMTEGDASSTAQASKEKL